MKNMHNKNLQQSKHVSVIILYLFGYKAEPFFFSFQNNLDPSYKMDLDLWD